MLDKFLNWFASKRKTIGYTIGGLNILVGLNHIINGDYGMALLWFAIGMMLVMDSYDFK